MSFDNNSDVNLHAFKAISEFIHDIEQAYGRFHKPLKLYNRLFRTKLFREKAVKKQIEIFRGFCQINQDAIINRKRNDLRLKQIKFSQRVYVDINFILIKADTEDEPIWNHFLKISTLLDCFDSDGDEHDSSTFGIPYLQGDFPGCLLP